MVDRCPLLIARCHSLGDVQSCLHFVRNQGLRVSVRGGGHNVAGHAVCEGGLVVDLSDMRAVEVGQDKSTVVIQGGATLGDVDMRTHPYGLATPMGVVTAKLWSASRPAGLPPLDQRLPASLVRVEKPSSRTMALLVPPTARPLPPT